MFIDQNKILCVDTNQKNIHVNKKQYSHILGGYAVKDFDKKVFVWHKKEIKEVHWKDLWNTMSVFWLEAMGDDYEDARHGVLDPKSIVAGISMFQAYDEEKWEKYYFLPKYSLEKMQALKQKLHDLAIDLDLQNTDKWVIFSAQDKLLEVQTLWYLFGLSLAYGKREIKEWDLKSVKIQVSLFGQYLEKQEELDMKILHLQHNGLFVTKTVQSTNSGLVYQIVVSDYEVLQIWDNLYQKIENIEKISKYEQMLEAKEKLIGYIKDNKLANEQELVDLNAARVKLLMK